jgi:hypothetical protein
MNYKIAIKHNPNEFRILLEHALVCKEEHEILASCSYAFGEYLWYTALVLGLYETAHIIEIRAINGDMIDETL